MPNAKLLLAIGCLLLSGCGHLNNIPSTPLQTPAGFLQSQPWVKIDLGGFSFIWTQPTSTVIVYFVGLFTMYVGYTFIRNPQKQPFKLWWGLGLILTGLGALFAGTSYQALGYEIKCNGREYCTFTSWCEVIYMWLSVPGMNAFLAATAYTVTNLNWRKAIWAYAVLNTIGYSFLLLYGVLFAVKFAVSFECMTLVSAPSIIFLLLLHAGGYAKHKNKLNLWLLYTWLIFTAVGMAYGIYLSSGFGVSLWQKGIWFTENDVLHLGMIGWVYYIFKKLSNAVVDLN